MTWYTMAWLVIYGLFLAALVIPKHWRWPDYIFHRWEYMYPYRNAAKAARVLFARLKKEPWCASAQPKQWLMNWTVELGVRDGYKVDWRKIPMYVGPVYVRAVVVEPQTDFANHTTGQ